VNVDQSPEQPTPAPAVTPPAEPTEPSTPPTTDTTAAAEPSGPAPATLCTFTTEDEAGFTSLTTCVVLEVFTEPDEDGNDVELARVAVLPDERIVAVRRLEPR
jgi:hypothetical protein